ncbi:MAG: hypothetical protein C3F13_13310 [Anaerolineales bacterium]|nr:MAG: hypothetical protein C3F13_13310 [Anaerolineales bacterium]
MQSTAFAMAASTDQPSITKIYQPGVILGLFLLSTATLAFEINLTRLFSVAQFYHFAFMIVSIALLGYGASGSVLTISPRLRGVDPRRSLMWLSLATAASILGAYILVNWLPFDSYSLMVDRKQGLILLLHYTALALPFFFSGIALAILLARYPTRVGATYAVNLLGSAVGCVIALLAPSALGGEGMVTLCTLLACTASLCVTSTRQLFRPTSIAMMALLLFAMADLASRISGQGGIALLRLHISPYKSLSFALQVPGSQDIYQKWNAYSRVDVVQSGGIHSVPGLSYRYLQPLPTMDGLLVDGDDLSPIVRSTSDGQFTSFLPAALAFELRPQGSTLVLEPHGGLDVLTALFLGGGKVTCVEPNPLIVKASSIYHDPRLEVHQESGRSYLQHSPGKFDIILLSLNSSFHPVQSGAYTLAEDYRYTLEAFQEMLSHLNPGGLLVAMRWLQEPPSEDLRLFALAVTAIENSGGSAEQQVIALRGYNTVTVLAKNGSFSPVELETVREFARQRAYDLIYMPGIQAAETNLYNILPESIYYATYLSLLQAQPRKAFYAAYTYDVEPPSDDHPFFGHYFKWGQTPQIIAEFGRAWLPFGGGGYFVILAVLALAFFLAALLIVLPVIIWKYKRKNETDKASPFILRNLVYFSLLGFAFLFVEIPLLQRFILYLEHPAYAVSTVLFALLSFSSLGSMASRRLSLRIALIPLVILILLMPVFLPQLMRLTLGLPLAGRLVITVLALAPLGFLMGVPFPGGIHLLEGSSQPTRQNGDNGTPGSDIAWIWAVNGAASVVAPILAALLALTYGFSLVLWLGGSCYLGALITVWVWPRPGAPQCLPL